MKKNVKKETRHLVAGPDAATTICGRPVGKVLVWAKKTAPKDDDATVCGRCRALKAGKKEKSPAEKSERPVREKKDHKPRTPALAILGDRMPVALRVTFKGKEYLAAVNPDGTITVNGNTFNSPSRAGKEVVGKEVDGWTFWSFEVEGEGLKKLDTLRKHDQAGQ